MDWDSASTDLLEQQLIADEREIGRLRARQLAVLGELDVRQVASADGSRSLREWVAGRLDVATDTARSLVATMRRLSERPDLEERLMLGEATYDRIEAISRIPEDVGLMEWADVAAVHREAAKLTRVTAEAETRSAGDRFLVMQPALDESWWRIWGGLDGHSGALVDKVLTEAADQLPEIEGLSTDLSWRRATALVECLISDDPPPAQLTVVVDAKPAAATQGEAGVVLDAGVRAGRQALEAILCDAETEVVARTEDGRYLDYGRRRRTAPPTLKRALLARAGHRCQADGCESRYRLQIHHLTPWSQGGETNQADLVVLCWYHHQVVVHERGMQIYFHHGRRIRFQHRGRAPPAPS
jgi:5-methylcytosine-specific restriction endonuclease McrA